MKIISLISQKGGSGKTTLSINLAIAATLAGKHVVLIDLDPQQSAARWSRLRTADAPVILSGHAPNLAELVDKARAAGANYIVIDTAPKSESASLVAAKLANLILIPCQPSSLDLDAVADTVNIAQAGGQARRLCVEWLQGRQLPDRNGGRGLGRLPAAARQGPHWQPRRLHQVAD